MPASGMLKKYARERTRNAASVTTPTACRKGDPNSTSGRATAKYP
jgi:hypothetical protein